MKHRLFTILSALSLLLFVAVCALWVRSYSATDVVRHGTSSRWYSLASDKGTLMFGTFLRSEFDAKLPWYQAIVPPHYDLARARAAVKRRGEWLGFRYFAESFAAPSTRSVHVPFWSVALLGVILPGLWLRQRLRHRYAPGQCPTCGYDLRATPGRCPECGMVANKSG